MGNNVRIRGDKALMFVKNAQEDVENGVAIVVGAGLAVDVELHHVGGFTSGFVDVSPDGTVYCSSKGSAACLAWPFLSDKASKFVEVLTRELRSFRCT
ncbi:hypothetical protein [Vreelandella andesensis]|uniref:hypothetical protein n=1 Tax=Vreelandella andesensis TaxID=447567 RepID=UPI001FC9B81F|nr:hypothetical protein [Halomonas andesensis]